MLNSKRAVSLLILVSIFVSLVQFVSALSVKLTFDDLNEKAICPSNPSTLSWRQNMVDYAVLNCQFNEPFAGSSLAYYYTYVNDCTNFISHCILAGGSPEQPGQKGQVNYGPNNYGWEDTSVPEDRSYGHSTMITYIAASGTPFAGEIYITSRTTPNSYNKNERLATTYLGKHRLRLLRFNIRT